MRIINRLIAAGALVVPMGLGVSGIAVADVAAGNSVPPAQIGASEDDGSKHCKDDKDGFLGLLGGGGDSDDRKCDEKDGDKGKDGDNGNGLLG